MASMIITPEAAAEEMAPQEYVPRYAVNELCVCPAGMEALAMGEPPAAGTIVQVTGTALVTSSSVRPESDGDVDQTMTLQLTDLTLSPPSRDAKAMFPNSKMED